jgi:hypothetical protein
MRVWALFVSLFLAGCMADSGGASHDHGDHEHDETAGDAMTLEFDVDEATDTLTVIKTVRIDWGKVTADLTDGCTARLEAQGMGADVGSGPLMAHRHDASPGDTISLEGEPGTCKITLTHETGAVLAVHAVTIDS